MESKMLKGNEEFNPDEFRIKFKAFLAVLAFIAAVIFLMTAMISTAAQTSKYTGTIIGFVTGTLITLIFSYYFGNSEPIQASNQPIQVPVSPGPKLQTLFEEETPDAI